MTQPEKCSLKVVLLGETNTGKSTFFNRIAAERQLLTGPQQNLTRDLIGDLAYSEELEKPIVIFDSQGLYEESKQSLETKIELIQARSQADLFLIVMDANRPPSHEEMTLVSAVQKRNIPYLLLMNKTDGEEQKLQIAADYYRLGSENLLFISSKYNRGLDQFWERLAAFKEEQAIPDRIIPVSLHAETAETEPLTKENKLTSPIRVALVGRPNAGKSSLLNTILGAEISQTSHEPFTTRDPVHARMNFHGQTILWMDTAGLRRKSRVEAGIEKKSDYLSIDELIRSDVVVVVFSVTEGLSDQDKRIIQLAIQKFKPILLVCNKMDLEHEKNPDHLKEDIRYELNQNYFLPIVFCSAKTKKNVRRILDSILRLHQIAHTQHKTSYLNSILEKAVLTRSPALRGNHGLVKFYFCHQVGSQTIQIQTNYPAELKDHYKTFMNRFFRKKLGMEDVPLKILFTKKNPSHTEAEGTSSTSSND